MADSQTKLATALSGRYRIEREIGVGGMATVYLAGDQKHNRKVALKVLKPELGAVLGVERFLAEIQVTANLQHPHLLPLFDSGEAEGLLFYVMPFVEGESLRARLERERQLPVDEAVRIATAAASALAYAHQNGVIHRDLKPENVLLQAGQPVIADFGIALAVSNAGGTRVTQTGLSLGTPQYMSPEQATGDRTIDARSDIYSLGAMTYEMLVGDPPHLGSTAQAIIAKVLTERPPSVQVGRPAVGDHVAYAVERALEKLPADRWNSANEFAEALRGNVATSGARTRSRARATTAPAGLPKWAWAALGTLSVIAVGGVGSAALMATRDPAPTLRAQFGIELADSTRVVDQGPGSGNPIAIARDGSQLVMAIGPTGRDGQLYLRRLDDPVPQPIRGTEGAMQASFSSDGESVVFHVFPELKVVPTRGGTPKVIVDSGAVAHWGDNGVIAYTHNGKITVTTPEGGQSRVIVGNDTATARVRVAFPWILPTGTHALVTWWKGENVIDSARIAVVSLSDGTFEDLGVQGTFARYASPGYIVFGRVGSELWAAPFSARKRAVTGPAQRLLENVWQNVGGQTAFAVSDNGTLVFRRGDSQSALFDLCAVDKAGAEECLPVAQAQFGEPRVSPDGKRIAVRLSADVNIAADVVVYDIAAGTRATLATGVRGARGPEWSGDGTRVVFQQRVGDTVMVMARRWDLSEPAQVLAKGTTGDFNGAIVAGPDAGSLVVLRRGTLVIAPIDSLKTGTPVVSAPGLGNFRVSPNGRILAYTSAESRRNEVFVTPLPGPGPRIPVSTDGGDSPVWSRDGSTLYYRGEFRMMSAGIVERPALAVTRRETLFDENGRYTRGFPAKYDILADGRFLMVRRPQRAVDRSEIILMTNWTQWLAGSSARPTRP
jgi:eukaryotic-like serine/threonine-protein kinase